MVRTHLTKTAGTNAAPPPTPGGNEVFLTGPQVRARYNVSDMTIHRWRKSTTLGFPEPVSINGRNYWREAKLVAWERARAGRAA